MGSQNRRLYRCDFSTDQGASIMDNQENKGAAEVRLRAAQIQNRIAELTGHKPSRTTLWRWHLENRLECSRIGGRIYSTDSAIREMLLADEQRNFASASQRGQLATERLEAQIASDRLKAGRN